MAGYGLKEKRGFWNRCTDDSKGGFLTYTNYKFLRKSCFF